MAADRIIYWGSGSAPCWKALIALEEKGLKFQDKLISFDKKEHKSEEIMKLNERGQVPTFRDGDIVINESSAIMDHVEDVYKSSGTQLIPETAAEKAKTRQLRAEISQNFQSVIVLPLIYYHFQTKAEDIDKDVLKKRSEKAREELKIWERKVKESEGCWLVGNKFTMADIELIVALCMLVRFGCNLEAYPILKKYYDNAITRPSIAKSWPPHWKDGEGKPILEALNKSD